MKRCRTGLLSMALFCGMGFIVASWADSPGQLPGLDSSIKELAKTARPQDIDAATADMQYQSAMCTAYYSLTYEEAVENGPAKMDLSKMKSIKDQSLNLTIQLANSLKMSTAAVQSQIKLDLDTLTKAMDHNWINVPVIVDKYGMPCKAFMESPLKSWAHWLQIERESVAHNSKRN